MYTCFLKNENHTFLSVSYSTPYQDPSGSKRTDGEIPPTLGIQLEQFSPAKKHLIIKDIRAANDICKFQEEKK